MPPSSTVIDSVPCTKTTPCGNLEGSMTDALLIARLKAMSTPQIFPLPSECKSGHDGANRAAHAWLPISASKSSPLAASPPDSRGLDLLSSASIISETSSSSSLSAIVDSVTKEVLTPKMKKERVYIEDEIRFDDILCGRGGRSNNHPGNKRYRQVVNDFRLLYQKTETKTVKTDLSREIVENCCSYGARFLKIDSVSGRCYVLTKAEARKKTSQALRETKDLKWIAPSV